MKRLMFLTIVMLLASSLGGNVSYADEIFWDLDKLPDATVTDKDFKLNYGNPNIKSFGDQEIYDTEKTFYEAKPPVPYVPQEASEPIEPFVRPQTQERQPPRVRAPEPSSRRTRTLDAAPQSAETDPEDTPAVGQPREQSRPRVQQLDKPGTSRTPASGTSEAPASKKMKWGMDSPPAEQKSEEKPKFQWGR